MNRIQEAIDARNVRVLIIAGIMIVIFLIKCFFAQGYFPKPNEQVWHIGTTPASSRRFGQCDATDDCLFFSHWGKISQVDAYGHDGTFLYSIEFQDSSNGRIYIRCENNLLYLKLRNNNVFVFRDQALLLGLSEKEADAQGFTNEWFRNGRSHLTIEDGDLLLLDESGQIIGPVSVPVQIALPTNFLNFGPETNGIVGGIVALLVLFVFLRAIWGRR